MFVGIDVKDTRIGMGLVNDKGELSFESTFPVDSGQDPDKVMLDIIYVVKSISETVPLELFNDRISGIGIGIHDAFMENSSLQETIQRYFDIPVFVESVQGKVKNEGIIAAGLLCNGRV
jgi:predicted NBD/HSP70 family sugar kinase